MGSVLVIAPHPDDETLGCGGTLLNHSDRGDALHWTIVTRVWEPLYPREAADRQAHQVKAVAAAYQFAKTDWLDFRTADLDALPLNTIICRLREVIEAVRPEIVYLPSPDDAHSDHRVVFQAAMAVLKTFYMRDLGIRRILACEIPSETDAGIPGIGDRFVPQIYCDISKTLERKLAIMQLFESEMHPEPLPRSVSAIRALARSRGATIGTEYAEAFMLVRELG